MVGGEGSMGIMTEKLEWKAENESVPRNVHSSRYNAISALKEHKRELQNVHNKKMQEIDNSIKQLQE